MKIMIAGLLACLALATAGAAQAATYLFTLTDAANPLGNFNFTLDSTPTVTSSSPGASFTIAGVTTNSQTTFGPITTIETYTFYTSDADGGFDGFRDVFFGPQLFTGGVDAPTFTLGTFPVTNLVTDQTLTISAVGGPAPPTGGVPEPTMWTVLLAGFGLTGGALRRRRAAQAA